MRRVALVITGLIAAWAANAAVRAAEPGQSMTVVGPSNPLLADGATALEEGRVEEGIRLTLDGLRSPTVAHDQAAGYANLCAGYALLQLWDEALKQCNASLALDKTNWRTFNNRAAVFSGQGRFDLALGDLRAGLEIAPNSRTLLESLRIVQQNKRLFGTRSRSAVRPP
jgi:tetratricopeptide (TPR) repeat protein